MHAKKKTIYFKGSKIDPILTLQTPVSRGRPNRADLDPLFDPKNDLENEADFEGQKEGSKWPYFRPGNGSLELFFFMPVIFASNRQNPYSFHIFAIFRQKSEQKWPKTTKNDLKNEKVVTFFIFYHFLAVFIIFYHFFIIFLSKRIIFLKKMILFE